MSAPLAVFRLVHAGARALAAKACMEFTDGVMVTFREPTRNLEQNAKMWAMLTDIAQQVSWVVDGKHTKLSKEDWKEITTAGLTKTQRVAQGIDGGFVMLGSHTSTMSIKAMSELIEFMYWFGAEKGVKWSEAVRDQ